MLTCLSNRFTNYRRNIFQNLNYIIQFVIIKIVNLRYETVKKIAVSVKPTYASIALEKEKS